MEAECSLELSGLKLLTWFYIYICSGISLLIANILIDIGLNDDWWTNLPTNQVLNIVNDIQFDTNMRITDQYYRDAGILLVFAASLQKNPLYSDALDDVTHVAEAISLRRCIMC